MSKTLKLVFETLRDLGPAVSIPGLGARPGPKAPFFLVGLVLLAAGDASRRMVEPVVMPYRLYP
jgi:hypothetical protein